MSILKSFRNSALKGALLLGVVSASNGLYANDACPFSNHEFLQAMFPGQKASSVIRNEHVDLAGKKYDVNVTDPNFDGELAKLNNARFDAMLGHVINNPRDINGPVKKFNVICDNTRQTVTVSFEGLPQTNKQRVAVDAASLVFGMAELEPVPQAPDFKEAPKYQRQADAKAQKMPKAGDVRVNPDGRKESYTGDRWVRR